MNVSMSLPLGGCTSSGLGCCNPSALCGGDGFCRLPCMLPSTVPSITPGAAPTSHDGAMAPDEDDDEGEGEGESIRAV